MDITLYIRELLFGHDCVIIPDFGGFIGNYIPSRVEKSTGTFFPPSKQISFNKNLNTNDGLLIGKISEANGIDFNEARAIVAKYVAELRKRLDNGETIVFDHIGIIANNGEGSVQFEPDVEANYCINSFGLEAFECFPLEKYDVCKKITEPENTGKKVHLQRIIWRAAVFVPLLILMVAAPLQTDVFKPKVETSTLNPLVTLDFEYNKPAVDKSVSIEENVIVTPLDETENAAVEISEKPVIEEKIIPVVNKYQLIVGSFQSSLNAQKQANALIAKGFVPEVIPAANGFFRVCAVECPDIETARFKRDSILSMFPETWILRKE